MRVTLRRVMVKPVPDRSCGASGDVRRTVLMDVCRFPQQAMTAITKQPRTHRPPIPMKTHKMMNPGMNLYSINNAGNKLAINGLPFGGDQMVMPLGINASVGSYTLNFVGLNILNDASVVYLKDNETGAIVDLNQNN